MSSDGLSTAEDSTDDSGSQASSDYGEWTLPVHQSDQEDVEFELERLKALSGFQKRSNISNL